MPGTCMLQVSPNSASAFKKIKISDEDGIRTAFQMRAAKRSLSWPSKRETHKMMLDHYQQTKNMLVSYSPKALGFF